MFKDPVCGMDVDKSTSFKVNRAGENYYFCSKHCLSVFTQGRRWYKNKTVLTILTIFTISVLSYFIPILEPFRLSFIMYLKRIWWAILLGFFLGGVIDYFIPREYISHILSKPKKRTILYSVVLGFFMSACSHGILALSIQLHKKGASNPAVVAFLLAAPWANITLTIMLLVFFGIKALYIIASALVIAITTGFIFQLLESKNLIEINENISHTDDNFSIFSDIRKRFYVYRAHPTPLKTQVKGVASGALALSDMVLWWVVIGMVFASLGAAYIPEGIFQNYMGPSLIGLLITLVVATILEVCSEGTAPLAFEIYRQTGALGNPFVFLMAGVVTDYTEIGLLWHNVGKRVAIFLPIVAVPQVIVLGIIANILF